MSLNNPSFSQIVRPKVFVSVSEKATRSSFVMIPSWSTSIRLKVSYTSRVSSAVKLFQWLNAKTLKKKPLIKIDDFKSSEFYHKIFMVETLDSKVISKLFRRCLPWISDWFLFLNQFLNSFNYILSIPFVIFTHLNWKIRKGFDV